MRTERGKKPVGSGLGLGLSTILVFFVILSLTTFATLSLVSANADKTLSRKAVTASVDYYNADSMAEETLARIDAELVKAQSERGSGDAYYVRCIELVNAMDGIEAYPGENNTPNIRYSVPMNESQELVVILNINEASADARYTLKTWKVVNTIDWDMEDGSLNLWQVEDGMMTLDNLP